MLVPPTSIPMRTSAHRLRRRGRKRCGLFAGTWDRQTSGCDANPDRKAQESYGLHFIHALSRTERTGAPLADALIDFDHDGVVGLAYAMRQVAQLLLMCDRHDIGISIASDEAETGYGPFSDSVADEKAPYPFSVKIFVYDNYPGGIGFSEPLFRMRHELLEGTRTLIASCDCENGCPGCVGPIGNTGPLAKTAALGILDRLLAEALAA